MGHYYSEMCCDDCGNLPCTCPPKPRPKEWVILWPYGEWPQIREEPGGLQRPVYRWDLPHFATLKKAQEALPGHVDDLIADHTAEIKGLQARLRGLRKLKKALERS